MNAAATANETIVAVATPPGRGGIGVMRMSGEGAKDVARRMLRQFPQPRVATYTDFLGPAGEQIDAGHRIRGHENKCAHVHGHNYVAFVMAMLVDAAIEFGARRAEPGEFSRRAFLNDKLDLAQAEAIADLISAGTEQAARAALRSLSGTFSGAVNALHEQVTAVRTYVEAAIDFPEEEIDFLVDDELAARLEECSGAFAALLENASVGRVLRDGFQVVIVGKPNAGKSSLMNRLSGEDTAIVTEVAGTTRDVLRERINIDGLAVELVDTAGLRNDPDRIEAEGIRRARAAIANADAVLWIQDATSIADETIDEELPQGIPITVVRNKIDLSGDAAGIGEGEPPRVCLSAKTGEGLDALRQRVRRLAGFRDLGEGAFTARRRHVEALKDAAQHFDAGRAALKDTRAGELLAEELRLAQLALGTITGEVTSDDLLGRIFSEFCIGKYTRV